MAKDYEVGRGRTPADTRWKKGGPSPNPKGRPPKRDSLDDIIIAEFMRPMTITERRADGSKKEVKVRAIQWLMRQWMVRSGKGDKHADNILRDLMVRCGSGVTANLRNALKENPEGDASDDAAMLAAYVRDTREREERIGGGDA
jgi:hypothetical protein